MDFRGSFWFFGFFFVVGWSCGFWFCEVFLVCCCNFGYVYVGSMLLLHSLIYLKTELDRSQSVVMKVKSLSEMVVTMTVFQNVKHYCWDY